MIRATVWLLCVLVIVNARNPGFKARITVKGLNYANDVAIQALVQNVKKTTIPDQSGSASGFDYSITNIRVTDFNPPSSFISLVPGRGLSWRASNAFIAVHGDFHYKKWFLKDSGSFDAKVSGVSFSIEMDLGKDSNGRPNISARNCGSSIGDVDFHFHGGMAWLYNLFRDKVGKVIQNTLNGQMCKLIEKEINVDGEAKLAEMKVTTTLAKTFLLDYQLVQAPGFQSNYLETSHKGEIYWASEPTKECPFTPPTMPANDDTSNMLYLFVSDYMFDSIGYSAQTHGFLMYNLTQNDLPSASRGVLNTTCDTVCVGKFIPQIGVKYPNMSVELRMNSTAIPRMNISTGGIGAGCQGIIDLYARKPGVSDTPFLISLFATMNTTVSVTVQNELLYAKIDTLKLNLTVLKSAVGNVPDEFLRFLTDAALKAYIIPSLNDLGKKGFPFPMTKEITFQNTSLTYFQDTLVIGTDLTYTPGKVLHLNAPLNFDIGVTTGQVESMDDTLRFKPRISTSDV